MLLLANRRIVSATILVALWLSATPFVLPAGASASNVRGSSPSESHIPAKAGEHWWHTYSSVLTDPQSANEAAVKPSVLRSAGYFGGWYGFWYYDDARYGNGYSEGMWNSIGQLGIKRMFYFDGGEIGDYAGFLDATGDMVCNAWSISFWGGIPPIDAAEWFGLKAFMENVPWAPYPTASTYGLPPFTQPDGSAIPSGEFYNTLSERDINGAVYTYPSYNSSITDQMAQDSKLDTISSKGGSGYWTTVNLWNIDAANPQLADYWSAELERLIGNLVQPYGVHIDNFGVNNLWFPSVSALGDWSLARFKTFMTERFTPTQLADMGITNIDTFDVPAYLKSKWSLNDSRWSSDLIWNCYKVFKAENGLELAQALYGGAKSKAAELGLDFAVTGNVIPLWPGAALIKGYCDIANFEWLADGSYPGFSAVGLPPRGRYGYITRLGEKMSDAPYCWINLYVKPPYNATGHDELHKVMAFDTLANRGIMDYAYAYAGQYNPGSDASARFINDFIAAIAPLCSQRSYLADIGLVFDPWCDVAASTVQGMKHDRFLDEYSGWADYLGDTHRQWDVILSTDISVEELSKYPIVVLPSVLVVTDDEAAALDDYLAAGGRLVVTGESGTRFGPEGYLMPRTTNGLDALSAHPNAHFTTAKPGKDYRLLNKSASAVSQMNSLLAFWGFEPRLTTNASQNVGVNLSVSVQETTTALTLDLNNYDLNVATDTVTPTNEVEVAIVLPEDLASAELMVTYGYAGMADYKSPVILPPERINHDEVNGILTLTFPSFTYYLVALIEENPAGEGEGEGEKPTVDFVAYPTWGKPPLTVEFSGQITGTTQQVIDWRWDFGDGTVLEGDEPNPTHVYTDEGQYAVSLTVTTASSSATETKQNLVLVSQSLPSSTLGILGILTATFLVLGGHNMGRKKTKEQRWDQI